MKNKFKQYWDSIHKKANTYFLVTFTDKNGRSDEKFESKKEAIIFANKKKSEGAEKIFIDKYDEDDDLIDYQQIN